jgi:hypothetical protein
MVLASAEAEKTVVWHLGRLAHSSRPICRLSSTMLRKPLRQTFMTLQMTCQFCHTRTEDSLHIEVICKNDIIFCHMENSMESSADK